MHDPSILNSRAKKLLFYVVKTGKLATSKDRSKDNYKNTKARCGGFFILVGMQNNQSYSSETYAKKYLYL